LFERFLQHWFFVFSLYLSYQLMEQREQTLVGYSSGSLERLPCLRTRPVAARSGSTG